MQHMKSMGLWQPWATAVASWSKDVENRGVISESAVGSDVAFYATASRAVSDVSADADSIRDCIRPDFQETSEFGCILSVGRIVGAMHPKRGPLGGWTEGHSESPWYTGGGAYAIGDSAPLLHPVSFRGAQYMKQLSQAELGEVLRQVRLCAGLRLHVEGWRYVAREVLAQLAVVGMLSPTFELTEAGRMALLKRRPQRRTSLKIMTGAWLPGAAWSAMTRAAE
ncbi:MAG: hypothetical protein KC766_21105 [Myxococcales bacterium]|nr:hypothetical protein [Myxococcales bacterium]